MEKEGREEGGKRRETASAAMKKAEEREPGGLQRGEQSSGRATRRTDPARETRQAAEAGAHVANYRGGGGEFRFGNSSA
jgi:hypothetical protein